MHYCMKCRKLKSSLNWHPKYGNICSSCKSELQRKEREDELRRNQNQRRTR